jgi:adenylate cyclase class 1
LESKNNLIRYLERGHATYCRTRFDSNTLRDHPLPAIMAANRRDTVQVFVHECRERIELFVLDEFGTLFHQRLPRQDSCLVIEHLARMLERSAARLAPGGGASYRIEAEFYRVVPAFGGWQLHAAPPPQAQVVPYLDVQALVDIDAGGATSFALYCDGQEFSSLNHGAGVFEAAARHILERRLSGLRYPIYITDVDLSPRLLAQRPDEPLQTARLLRHKRTIEARLNRLVREGAGRGSR